MNENIYFQAYSTVVLAAEGNDPDSEHFGKVDEVKQYPSRKKSVSHRSFCAAAVCVLLSE